MLGIAYLGRVISQMLACLLVLWQEKITRFWPMILAGLLLSCASQKTRCLRLAKRSRLADSDPEWAVVTAMASSSLPSVGDRTTRRHSTPARAPRYLWRMAASPFHPELQSLARWLPRGVGRLWLVKLLRRLPIPAAKLPEGMTVQVHALDAIAVRVIGKPSEGEARPVILWIHGGGYVIGAAKQDDMICARLAKRLDAIVVSIDYRLAPEHPFPTPLEDCFAAYEFVQREAALLGVDPARLVIAGQSAGGGLAAALTLLVHDRQRPPPKLQLLIYPMLDDRTVLRSVDDGPHRLWDSSSNRLGWTCYLGREPGSADVSDHAAPARRSDASGLPPTWIGVGTCDLFHDEDLAYAERLRAAGVPVTLEVVEGAFHAFDVLVPKAEVSRRFFDSQVHAIEAALS